MTIATDFFDMTGAPMRIGAVRLKVRDLHAVSAFYQTVLGLSPVATGDHGVTLGTGGTPLVELVGDPSLAPLDTRQAGLFHTAFLMPTRADLARWVAHVAAARVPLEGASDHIVSEALYLADPEGNGIEVYADRPVSDWLGEDGEIKMSTDPLDVQDLLQSAHDTEWAGFPQDGSVGHVHLRVGDTVEADHFYRDVLGLDVTVNYPGASFYGSGGYHHQIAGNVWNSRRAGKRPEHMAGLDAVEVLVADDLEIMTIATRAQSAGIPSTRNADGLTLHDPWGTAIMLKT